MHDRDDFAEEVSSSRTSRDRALLLVRCALIFAAIFGCLWAGMRWTGSAVRYAASAASDSNVPQYQISGKVIDEVNGHAVPWASLTVSETASKMFIQSTADVNGEFQLQTFPERQRLTVRAEGYEPRVVSVGPQWFLFAPKNAEIVSVALKPH